MAPGAVVDRPGDDLFARPGLAENEHRDIRAGDEVDAVHDAPQAAPLAHDRLVERPAPEPPERRLALGLGGPSEVLQLVEPSRGVDRDREGFERPAQQDRGPFIEQGAPRQAPRDDALRTTLAPEPGAHHRLSAEERAQREQGASRGLSGVERGQPGALGETGDGSELDALHERAGLGAVEGGHEQASVSFEGEHPHVVDLDMGGDDCGEVRDRVGKVDVLAGFPPEAELKLLDVLHTRFISRSTAKSSGCIRDISRDIGSQVAGAPGKGVAGALARWHARCISDR